MNRSTASPSRSGEERLAKGQRVAGRYIVESVIGEGATSVVYLARVDAPGGEMRASPAASELGDDSQPVSLRLVALKVIHQSLGDDPQIVGRFRREAAILKRIEGPHVLRVHEALEDQGRLVLVLEYVAGVPLDQHLTGGERFKVRSAIEIALQVCAGLGSAHAAGVVHRDLKPANVLYAADEAGERALVKVADFGLAKMVHGDKMITGLTEHDMIFGTPEYMAPEQARGEEVDGRADLYALGCMLYEMLSGEVPLRERTPMQTITAHVTEEVVPLRRRRPDAALSSALEAVVMRALAKSPADRYPTARAFAEALAAAAAGRVVATTSSTADELGDTDLHVAASAPPEEPDDEPLAEDPGAAGLGVTHAAPAVTSPQPVKDASPAARKPAAGPRVEVAPMSVAAGPRWVWVAVAVIAALVAIGVGVALGAR